MSVKEKKSRAKKNLKSKGSGFALAELMTSFYQADGLAVLLESPVKMYRWKGPGPRRYFCFGDPIEQDGVIKTPVQWFPSVTTVIDEVFPTSQFLIEWIAKVGLDRARVIADESAAYGTLMHIAISQFLVSGLFSLEDHALEAFVSRETEARPEWERMDRSGWAQRLARDMVSFAQFAADVQLEPVSIESVHCSFALGIAGAIDCVAWINVQEKGFWGEVYKSGPNKGAPKETVKTKRVLVLIDWKSCRSGFYAEHELQLELYRRIWNEVFSMLEGYQVEEVYNWRPTDWISKPSYHFKNQTGKAIDLVEHVVALAQLRLGGEPSAVKRNPEKIVLREPPTVVMVDATTMVSESFAPKAKGGSNARKKKQDS